jgi:hypothetical protein
MQRTPKAISGEIDGLAGHLAVDDADVFGV